MEKNILKFPKNFLWGAATSAHQVEGGNVNNDWWRWEQLGKIKDSSVSGKACDHYRLFEDDFKIARKMGHNVHRLSIEWSRIEPSPGKWNLGEIDHYRKVLNSLKENNMKTMVTLHHFTNPLWFADLGGWENKKSAFYFSRFAEFIAKKLGDKIDFWITINEPGVYVSKGYLEEDWPPERRSIFAARRVTNNMIKAHQSVYQKIHQILKERNNNALVGIAKNNIFYEPYCKYNPLDIFLVSILRYLTNFLFLNSIKKELDFIGLNYYFHYKLRFNLLKVKNNFVEIKNDDKEVSDFGWEIYPRGIYKVLKELKKYNKPIFITENGVADRSDIHRTKFILEHLKEIHRAIQDGVDVRGYFHWSLLDNFEWKEGFKMRFGLIKVDFKNYQRRVRKSAKVFAEICKNNSLVIL